MRVVANWHNYEPLYRLGIFLCFFNFRFPDWMTELIKREALDDISAKKLPVIGLKWSHSLLRVKTLALWMSDLGPFIYSTAARQDLIKNWNIGAVLCGRKRRCGTHLLSDCGGLSGWVLPWYDCVRRHYCCVGGSRWSLWIDWEHYLRRLRLALGVGTTQHADQVLAESHVLGVRRISATRHSLVRWGTLLPAEEGGRKTLAVVVWKGHSQLRLNGRCLSWGLGTCL